MEGTSRTKRTACSQDLTGPVLAHTRPARKGAARVLAEKVLDEVGDRLKVRRAHYGDYIINGRKRHASMHPKVKVHRKVLRYKVASLL